MIVAQRLRDIAHRTQHATPGPWTWADWDQDPSKPPWPDHTYTLQAPPETRPGGPFATYLANVPNRLLTDSTRESRVEDRLFIAHTRMDIPFLLELVWRLKIELTKLQQERMMSDAKQEEVRGPWA